MADNLKGIPFSNDDEGIDFPSFAKKVVFDQAKTLVTEQDFPSFSINDVYIVWFAYTLGSWKALCSTAVPDGRYYEVTYKGAEKRGFVDTYRKTHNNEFYITD